MTARRLVRVLMYIGVAVVVAGLSKVHARYVAEPAYDYTGSFRFAWSVAYIAVLCLAAYGVGLPDLIRRERGGVFAGLAATATGALAISLVQGVGGGALLPRFVVFGSALVLVPWFAACVAVARGGHSRAEDRDRVVVVGDGDDADGLKHDLLLDAERPAAVVSCLRVDEAAFVGDGAHPLIDAVAAGRATVVVLDRSAQANEAVVGQAAVLHAAGVRIRTMTLFYEEWLAKLPVSELERVSLMFDIGEIHRARYGRFKRLLDIVAGLVGVVLLGLMLPMVVLGDLIRNRGPLLYRQTRVGKQGRHFDIVKFRTMRPSGSGELAGEWTTEGDPRITPFGRVLRRTHLDELPQAWNILRGDLSVVGPRPEQPRYVRELSEKLPFYDVRHLVRPGLTGWAQVKYGYAGNESDALEKLQYEFFYLRHQSLTFDIRVIARTVRSVLSRAGR